MEVWEKWIDRDKFSGVFAVSDEHGVIFEKCCGYRNRSENLPNNIDTAFGIASGTKLFTGLSVCKLIKDKKLSLEDKLWDILPYDLGQIDKDVTAFHLLTHTSGIGDYIDEESDNGVAQMRELYRNNPVYLWDNLEYYLHMITPLLPKFKPGERFGYSNAGFVLLGLVIEAVSGISYQSFVKDAIITPHGLVHTGFYRLDSLPANTAYGYMDDGRTNIFNMPIIGGADGGIFTCAKDLDKLWRNMVIDITDFESYGLGSYRYDDSVYYAVGGDFGVDFFTAYFPQQKIVVSALGNTEINTFPLLYDMLTNATNAKKFH